MPTETNGWKHLKIVEESELAIGIFFGMIISAVVITGAFMIVTTL